MGDARDAEKQGKLPDALNDYAMVLKLQPGNPDAQSNSARIEQTIKSDPAAARNELVSAIRYFYLSQFDDARRSLLDYLESPQTAQSPGVADFYLGATLVERSMLANPRAEWKGPSEEALSAFKTSPQGQLQPGTRLCLSKLAEDMGIRPANRFWILMQETLVAQRGATGGLNKYRTSAWAFRKIERRERATPSIALQ